MSQNILEIVGQKLNNEELGASFPYLKNNFFPKSYFKKINAHFVFYIEYLLQNIACNQNGNVLKSP